MKKTLLFIFYKMLTMRDIIIVSKNRLISKFIIPPIVKTTDQTLSTIVNNNISVSRFGDGEFALICGESLLFQPYCPKLSTRLMEIVKSNQKGHIVCIPNIFYRIDWCEDKPKKYWTKYLNLNRGRIYKLLDMKKTYYDAQVTRLYIDHKDKSMVEQRFCEIKKIWENKDIVIVEGNESRLGVGNDLFNSARTVSRIICPSINAFSKYNEVLAEVKKQDKTKLVLIALGPTATVLSYDLSLDGYQAIDIGHIDIEYEWFLQKATEKCPIKNKYIGEIQNGTDVADINDHYYENQIILTIN